MRSIVELLEVLRDNIEFMDLGLCSLTRILTLDGSLGFNEYAELMYYIGMHRPTYGYDPNTCSLSALKKNKVLKTIDREHLIKTIKIGNWGWLPGEIEPRLKWLNERIEIEKTK